MRFQIRNKSRDYLLHGLAPLASHSESMVATPMCQA